MFSNSQMNVRVACAVLPVYTVDKLLPLSSHSVGNKRKKKSLTNQANYLEININVQVHGTEAFSRSVSQKSPLTLLEPRNFITVYHQSLFRANSIHSTLSQPIYLNSSLMQTRSSKWYEIK